MAPDPSSGSWPDPAPVESRPAPPTPGDQWDPGVYERFATERSQPFFDLVGLCTPVPGARVVDLGCGTGKLTARLPELLAAGETRGLDSSAAMLAEASPLSRPGLDFAPADIAWFGTVPEDVGRWDVVFSNAALHWVPEDHSQVLLRWRRALRPGGQLAVQVPANADHPAHSGAAELAGEEPFLSALSGSPAPDPVTNVLPPEAYAEALHALGFVDQHVRLQVYGHLLPSTEAVADWVSGSSLTRFRARMDPAVYEAFLVRYRERLVQALGRHEPYFYTFKRILFWGRLPA